MWRYICEVLKVTMIHQHAKLQTVPFIRFPGNAQNLSRQGMDRLKTVTVGRMDQRTNVWVERWYFGLQTDKRVFRRRERQPEIICLQRIKGKNDNEISKSGHRPYNGIRLIDWLSCSLAVLNCFRSNTSFHMYTISVYEGETNFCLLHSVPSIGTLIRWLRTST